VSASPPDLHRRSKRLSGGVPAPMGSRGPCRRPGTGCKGLEYDYPHCGCNRPTPRDNKLPAVSDLALRWRVTEGQAVRTFHPQSGCQNSPWSRWTAANIPFTYTRLMKEGVG
jgi:hypothetical protein